MNCFLVVRPPNAVVLVLPLDDDVRVADAAQHRHRLGPLYPGGASVVGVMDLREPR